MHTAPLIREMDEARQTAGLLNLLDSVGYTVRKAQETAGQVPTPKVTPDGGIGYFYFGGQKITPSL
jgi:hypothetical protein